MKTADKLATVVFWIVTGCLGLVLGGFVLYFAFIVAFETPRSGASSWWFVTLSATLLVGMTVIVLVILGVRQCIRTLRNNDKNNPV